MSKDDTIYDLIETFLYSKETEEIVLKEADAEEDETVSEQIQLFYSDLEMEGKKKVLEAIDNSYEYVDVFSDDIVRANIEEALSKRPLITLSGEELVNKMDIEL